MAPLLTYRGVVYPWHCDHMGHMNVSFYVAKFDEASWQLFAHCGITRSYCRENNVVMAGVHQELNYKRELMPGDVVRIETTLDEIGRRKLVWIHKMYDDVADQLVATCGLTAVHVDAASRRPSPIPDEIRARANLLQRGPS